MTNYQTVKTTVTVPSVEVVSKPGTTLIIESTITVPSLKVVSKPGTTQTVETTITEHSMETETQPGSTFVETQPGSTVVETELEQVTVTVPTVKTVTEVILPVNSGYVTSGECLFLVSIVFAQLTNIPKPVHTPNLYRTFSQAQHVLVQQPITTPMFRGITTRSPLPAYLLWLPIILLSFQTIKRAHPSIAIPRSSSNICKPTSTIQNSVVARIRLLTVSATSLLDQFSLVMAQHRLGPESKCSYLRARCWL